MKKQNNWLILLLILTLVTTGYIFSNSLKDGVKSNESSDKIVEIVEPIVGEKPGGKDVSFWVRKAAHVFEFALLGACAMLLGLEVKRRFGLTAFGYVLFYVLLTAVTDEYIQSFTDRTSSVKDVFIDLGGALLGILIAALAAAVRGKNKKTQ